MLFTFVQAGGVGSQDPACRSAGATCPLFRSAAAVPVSRWIGLRSVGVRVESPAEREANRVAGRHFAVRGDLQPQSADWSGPECGRQRTTQLHLLPESAREG